MLIVGVGIYSGTVYKTDSQVANDLLFGEKRITEVSVRHDPMKTPESIDGKVYNFDDVM